VGVSKEERKHQQQRADLRREIERKTALDAQREQSGLAYEHLVAAARGYDSLWAHLGSGEFRSLSMRPDGSDGGTFILKAVLEVQQTPYGVYMYGEMKHASDLPGLLDRLLLRADWREDKYYRP